jgi:hypothetical protein
MMHLDRLAGAHVLASRAAGHLVEGLSSAAMRRNRGRGDLDVAHEGRSNK